jgi:EAL domain-containing protein (putative c-di-GMP-specific phosphodiesterase class I)
MLVEGFEGVNVGAVAIAPLTLLSVRVANFRHIEGAFGGGDAVSVGEVLNERIARFLDGAVCIERVDVDRWEALLFQSAPLADSLNDRFLTPFLQELSCPVECGDHAIIACVQAGVASLDAGLASLIDEDVDRAREDVEARLDDVMTLPLPGRSEAWRRAYRSDMAQAVWLWRDIHAGRLCPAWQPIVSAEEEGGFLYQELQLRGVPLVGSGEELDRLVERARPALERLGLTHWFDMLLLKLVIDALRATPDVRLGCAISAQTALAQGWWGGMFAALADAHTVGARLVVGIGGKRAGLDGASLFGICRALKGYGAAVALHDVGLGRAPQGEIVALDPQIVKIGGSLLRWASNDALLPMAGQELVRLIALARGGGRAVVVEGVETERLRAVAASAGAEWLQGEAAATTRISGPWPVQAMAGALVPLDGAGSERAAGACEGVGSFKWPAAAPFHQERLSEGGSGLRGVMFGVPISLALWAALFGIFRWLV